MHLKSLEISGFKSFAKKANLEFNTPITGIVGPNGSGKCVDGGTLVQLEDGSIKPIKELFDMAQSRARAVTMFDDGMAVIDTNVSFNVAALNLYTLKTDWRHVTAFVRRTAPEKMLEINTRSGRTITATPYHPLFGCENGTVHSVRADAVKTGLRIATPRSLPVVGRMQRIMMKDVAAAFKPEDNVYVPYSPILEELMDLRMIEKSVTTTRALERVSGVEECVFARVRMSQAMPVTYLPALCGPYIYTFGNRTLKSKGEGTMKIPEYIDEEVARFLGYIIAEGRTSRNGQVWYVNDDPASVADYVSCVRKCFGLEAKVFSYKGDTKDVITFSITLARVLDKIFGMTIEGPSRTKKVPPQIFQSRDHVVEAFLGALYDGDGHFSFKISKSKGNRQAYIEYTSASEELARGVSTLLLRLGILSDIQKKEKCATNTIKKTVRPYWSVYVYGNANIRRFVERIQPKGRKSATVRAMLDMEANQGNPNHDLIPGIIEPLHELIKEAGVSVKKARKENSTLAAYYERRCLPSRGGVDRVIDYLESIVPESNTAWRQCANELRKFASSDVLWDEIVSVREIPSGEYVYDLTVDEDHNFIANNIFAHNSNVAEAFRFVLGEQSIKSLRGKRGEDMIWNGGGETSGGSGKGNRASVKLTFDNSRKIFSSIDFDEVVIERVVHRDNANEYLLNGSQVRLKDIIELLATAHIGASGHHIISQGEADRILSASIRERREMVEDALGLKLYQWKKLESLHKLERTEENMKQVESLRREIAPHIRFLKKQVEKVEKAEELRKELIVLYQEYFASEEYYLNSEKSRLVKALSGPQQELSDLDRALENAKKIITDSKFKDSKSDAVISVENRLAKVRADKDSVVRELGRIEGEISANRRAIEKEHSRMQDEESKTVYLRDVEEVVRNIERLNDSKIEGLDTAEKARNFFLEIISSLKSFITKNRSTHESSFIGDAEKEIANLTEKKVASDATLQALSRDEVQFRAEYDSLRDIIEKEKDTNREAEKDVFKIIARQNEVRAVVNNLTASKLTVGHEEEAFKREMGEAHMLVGRDAVNWVPMDIMSVGSVSVSTRQQQEERRKKIERNKVRLEDSGGSGGAEVMKEFRETEERDAFLAKELEDLKKAGEELRKLTTELDARIDMEFKTGILKINSEFKKYFSLMFGGGHAELTVVREVRRKRKGDMDDLSGLLRGESDGMLSGEMSARLEGESYSSQKGAIVNNESNEELLPEGLDVNVSLPRKKIKGLMMLSGGERALTSIALLFAISQVNPPPFVILDETDAALDEANSRKYGDMIADLSEHSQLILITHNRETMSRAGVLYGITMGSDGASRLLSIQFEEAVKVAK